MEIKMKTLQYCDEAHSHDCISEGLGHYGLCTALFPFMHLQRHSLIQHSFCFSQVEALTSDNIQ